MVGIKMDYVASNRKSIERSLRRTLVHHSLEQQCTSHSSFYESINEVVLKGERRKQKPSETKRLMILEF
jgi:hypothetical protein